MSKPILYVVFISIACVFCISCSQYPVYSSLPTRNFVQKGTRGVAIQADEEVIQQFFIENGYRLSPGRDGFRTYPIQIDPITWAIYKAEARHDGYLITAFWTKNIENNENEETVETEPGGPSLSAFKPVIFKKPYDRPGHVIEHLIMQVERSPIGFELEEIMSDTGERVYKKSTLTGESILTDEEKNSLEALREYYENKQRAEEKRKSDASLDLPGVQGGGASLLRFNSSELQPPGIDTRDLASWKLDFQERIQTRHKKHLYNLPSLVHRVQFFASRESGRKFNRLEELGEVIVEKVPDRDIYRYLLGNFETREEAKIVVSRLQDLGYREAFVFQQ